MSRKIGLKIVLTVCAIFLSTMSRACNNNNLNRLPCLSSDGEKCLKFKTESREVSKNFEINRTIYLNYLSEQILKSNAFLTYSRRFLRAITIHIGKTNWDL